jgi:hypothetical protein
MAKFHWSLVGAVALSVTVAPAAVVGVLAYWTQKLSPVGARNSCTLV